MKFAAFFGQRNGSSPVQVVDAMLAAQALTSGGASGVIAVPGGAIGWQRQGDSASRVELLRIAPNGNVLLVTGVPTAPRGGIDAWLQQVIDAHASDARSMLEQCDGAFACLHWDDQQRRVTIVGDMLGLQPVHWADLADGVAMATDLRAFSGAGLLPVRMDPAGWGAFVAVGHMLAAATQLRGARRFPPAGSWQLDPATGAIDRRTYWSWPDGAPASRPTDVVEALQRQCHAYADYTPDAHILLSGGFDSRLIAFTLARDGQRPTAIVHEHGDEDWSADSRFATRVAGATGLRVVAFPTQRQFYSSDEYLDYLVRTEVSVPSLNLFIAQAATGLDALGVQAVWEGWAPGAFLGPRVASGGITDWYQMVTARRGAVQWQAAEKIFAAAMVKEMREAFEDELEQTRACFTDDKPGAYRFLALTRGRYRTGQNPLRAYGSTCLPFMPGTTRAFIGGATGLAENATSKLGSHGVVFREVFPQYLDIPFSSNGKLLRLTSRFDPEYYVCQLANRARRNHRLGRTLALVGFDVRSRRPAPSRWVRTIVQATVPHGPEANPDGIRELQRNGWASPVGRAARELLFYWRAWQMVLRGGPAQQFIDGCHALDRSGVPDPRSGQERDR